MKTISFAMCGVILLSAPHKQAGSSTFVTAVGADSITEQMLRTDTSLTGDFRRGSTVHVRYRAHLGSGGMVDRLDLQDSTAARYITATLSFGPGSVEATGHAGDRPFTLSFPVTSRAYAYFLPSYGLMEELERHTHLAVGDSAVVDVINIRQLREAPLTIKRVAADSFDIGDYRIAVGAGGVVMGGRGIVAPSRTVRR